MALCQAQFGVSTFFASSHANDKCGANGLPLTPNSIKAIGRFQHLRTLDHRHVCKYLDCVKGKHERLVIVQEHYTNNLSVAQGTGKYRQETELIEVAFEILQGLAYLNRHGITHRNLKLNNVLFNEEGRVKLSECGVYYMTDGGASVGFPIGFENTFLDAGVLYDPNDVSYIPPEPDMSSNVFPVPTLADNCRLCGTFM